MQDAPEQAQAAEAQEPVAAETSAAQETSAPVTPATNETPKEPTTLSELDRIAAELLAPTTEAKPEEKPAEATPETKPEDDEEIKPPSERVRLTSLKDTDKALVNTAVQMVRDGLAEDIEDAMGKLIGKPAQSQAAPTTPEPEQQPDPYTVAVEAQKTAIAEVKAQLTQAKKDFNDEEETDLTDKLLDLKSDLKLMEFKRQQETESNAKQQQESAAQTFESQYGDFRQQAVSLYPDSDKAGTPLYDQVKQEVAWFEKNNPAIFNTPDYPLTVSSKAALKLGIAPQFAKPAAATAAAATQSPNAKVAARPANPLVGGNATTVSSDTKSAARQVEAVRDMRTLEALAQAAFA